LAVKIVSEITNNVLSETLDPLNLEHVVMLDCLLDASMLFVVAFLWFNPFGPRK